MNTNPGARWQETYRLSFSWSYTRAQAFNLCRRMYYYRYYAPYGGNAPDEPDDRALLRTLGKLTTLPALVGTIVHTIARDSLSALRSERAWEDATSLASARALLHRALAQSAKAAQGKQGGARVQVLMEHYFRRPVDEQAVVLHLDNLIKALLAHPVYLAVSTIAYKIVLLDEIRRFPLDGVTVFSVPDVLLKEQDGYRIIDWKTGRSLDMSSEQAHSQLELYALYLVVVEHVEEQAITCELVDITGGSSYTWVVTSEQIDAIRQQVRSSSSEMRRLLVDVERNVARREAFALRTSIIGGDSVCRRCVFRELCFGISPAI